MNAVQNLISIHEAELRDVNAKLFELGERRKELLVIVAAINATVSAQQKDVEVATAAKNTNDKSQAAA